MPDGSSCILSGEMSPLPFAHSINELFGCLFILQSSFAAELYEWAPVCFRYQPLMRSVFCKYFLLFLSRLLVLPMAPFAVQKLSESMCPHLFAFGLKSKKLGARPVPGSAVSGARPCPPGFYSFWSPFDSLIQRAPRSSRASFFLQRWGPHFFRIQQGCGSTAFLTGRSREEREEAFGRVLGRK